MGLERWASSGLGACGKRPGSLGVQRGLSSGSGRGCWSLHHFLCSSSLLRWSSSLLRWSSSLLRWSSGLLRWSSGLLRWSSGLLRWSSGLLRWSSGLLRWSSSLLGWSSSLLRWSSSLLRWGSSLLGWSSGLLRWSYGFSGSRFFCWGGFRGGRFFRSCHHVLLGSVSKEHSPSTVDRKRSMVMDAAVAPSP